MEWNRLASCALHSFVAVNPVVPQAESGSRTGVETRRVTRSGPRWVAEEVTQVSMKASDASKRTKGVSVKTKGVSVKRKLAKGIAIALTVLAVSPALAQEGQMGDPEPDDAAGMDGMPMGQGMMQDGMMQMMSHCASAMEQMHGGRHGHEGMGEMNGMRGMGMPGMMGGNETVGFEADTAEALARAFVRGRSGDDAATVEIVGVTVADGNFLVEYRQGDSQGTVLVNAETGEVTEVDG